MNYVYFPRWAEVLASGPLDQRRKESHKAAIIRYLAWLRRQSELATVNSARKFVAEIEAETAPGGLPVEELKEGIRWFFQNGPRRKAKAPGNDREWARQEDERSADIEVKKLKESWERELIATMRRKGMALKTEQSYLAWCRRFSERLGCGNPLEASEQMVSEFLDYLAVDQRIAGSTQRQALNALVFLLREVAGRTQLDLSDYRKARGRKRIPIVLDREEVRVLFQHLDAHYLTMAKVQYGTGIRVSELTRLRIKDIDFNRGQVIVRGGKGDKDRITPLPVAIEDELKFHLEGVRKLFEKDRLKGLEGTYLPPALSRKYPNAGKEWPWQWLWPSREISRDPRSDVMRRHHLLPRPYQAAIKSAAQAAGFNKRVTSHSLRHSFATHLLESGTDIRTVQDLLGHAQVETTMVYLHVMKKPGAGSLSPLDGL